jgi:hypothetical protein
MSRKQLIVVLLLVAGVCGAAMAITGDRSNKKKLRCDVPVSVHLSWCAYQNDLDLEKFEASVADPSLGFLHSQTVVTYHLTGHLRHGDGVRPFIRTLQISERIGTPPANDPHGTYADILLTPVVDVIYDDKYKGPAVPFDLVVQQPMETLNWGENHYVIRCAERQVEVTVCQNK